MVLSKELDPELVTLLKDTVWGTKGAQYTHLDVEERMTHMKNPYFLSIYRNGRILGNVSFSWRLLETDQGPVNAYYIRYFAFQNSMKSGANKKRTNEREGFLKRFLKRIWEEGFYQEDYNYGEDPNLPFVFYAYIDSDNLRSMQVGGGLGLTPVGQFATVTFSRINPKQVTGIEKLAIADRPDFRKKIQAFYKDYVFADWHDLFRENNYYVYRSNGEIIIGGQVHVCHWRVKNMADLKTKMLVKLAPYIPGLNKVFNPKNMVFINVDHLYVKPGHEDALIPFLEGLLTIKGIFLCLMWYDLRNPIGQFLMKHPKLGPIAKLSKVTPANILINKNKSMSDELFEELSTKTSFLSGFDMT